jgi:hypothetical protein
MENNLPLHLEERLLKNLKRSTLILALLLLPLILGACGGVSLGSPESAAESFYKAVENKNEDNLKDSLCSDLEDTFSDVIATFDNEDTDIDYEFSLEFAEKEDDNDDEAVVAVYGRVRLREVTDNRDVEYKLGSRNDAPLAEIRLVKDGDDWKVCDPTALSFPTSDDE